MSTGVVIIGRNEGRRLEVCLKSIVGQGRPVVYVDSGSTDGSVGLAKSLGADCVELDMSVPFTAARARNAGFGRLMGMRPDLKCVQFVDGDCEMDAGWIEEASAFLESHPDVAVVCGRLIERFPEQSIYNRYCQLEWDGPSGEIPFSGGIAMARADAFEAVGGFNPGVIAGEEPEMCVRLRLRDWRIWRLQARMALHDAAMTRFRQWWRRAERAGHAYAEGAAMHGRTRFRHWVRETRSNWFWGMAVPLLVVAAAWPTRGLSGLLLLGYPMLGWRIHRFVRRSGRSRADAALYAIFCVLAKFAEAIGQLRYCVRRLRGRPSTIIEYKGPAAPAGVGA